jgi:hypothetical protein
MIDKVAAHITAMHRFGLFGITTTCHLTDKESVSWNTLFINRLQ